MIESHVFLLNLMLPFGYLYKYITECNSLLNIYLDLKYENLCV